MRPRFAYTTLYPCISRDFYCLKIDRTNTSMVSRLQNSIWSRCVYWLGGLQPASSLSTLAWPWLVICRLVAGLLLLFLFSFGWIQRNNTGLPESVAFPGCMNSCMLLRFRTVDIDICCHVRVGIRWGQPVMGSIRCETTILDLYQYIIHSIILHTLPKMC